MKHFIDEEEERREQMCLKFAKKCLKLEKMKQFFPKFKFKLYNRIITRASLASEARVCCDEARLGVQLCGSRGERDDFISINFSPLIG